LTGTQKERSEMTRKPLRIVACLVLAGLLAACGGTSGPEPTPTRAPRRNTGDCPRAGLENWLQRSNALTAEFFENVDDALETPRAQFNPLIEKLAELRSTLAVIQAPGCALEHYDLVADVTNQVIEGFRDFRNGKQMDLPAFVGSMKNRYALLKTKEAELNALYITLSR
jgi:hypothetical protein